MKKIKYILPILIIIIIAATIALVSYNYKNKEDISKLQDLWHLYDSNLSKIESNMSKITKSSGEDGTHWWELKENGITDEEYLSTLNILVGYIRVYYDTLLETNYENSNPLLTYRNKDTITKNEIITLKSDLNQNSSIYQQLKSFDNFEISKDKETAQNFLSAINETVTAIDIKNIDNAPTTYAEILIQKNIEIDSIAKLTDWLKEEVYSYSN